MANAYLDWIDEQGFSPCPNWRSDDEREEVNYERDIKPDANQTIDEAWEALKRYREQRNT